LGGKNIYLGGYLTMGEGTMKRKNKYNMMPVTRIILIISVTIFLCINPFLQKVYALNGADVALYNDSIAPSGYSGVWQDGITAIKNMLTTKGFTYEEITYKDLNESTQNFSNLYKVILIPGGTATWYNYWISKAGKERIRNFIKKGGGYLGICAGAYFACDRIVLDGVTYDDNFGYNAYGELTGYDLDLFSGTGTGPINEIANYYAGESKMTTINFQTENTVLKGYKQIPFTEDILYYGGPYFTPDIGSQVEILGTYNEYNGQPAIVAFTYGSGKVVLSGPHPEIGGSNWDLAKYMLNWLMKPNIPSCPSLYFWNGYDYERGGFIFPGAMPRENEYVDHIPLKQLGSSNGYYYLQIRETESENSFINMAKLIIVDHNPDVNITDLFIHKETESIPHPNPFEVWYKNSIALDTLREKASFMELSPFLATHSVIGDVVPPLYFSDDEYVRMNTGDIITLMFPALPLKEGEIRDFIFVGEGFYVPLYSLPPPPPPHEEVCNNWARTAVAQNEENLRRRCGFTGPQWNSDYNNHFQFCLSVPWESAISAENAREYDLRNRCRGY
jgi:glutamine amidotransferase-like uncharacterized protein